MQQRQRQEIDWQQEVRARLDDMAKAQQQMALDLQAVRVGQTPRPEIETMINTRVSVDVYNINRAEIVNRLNNLENAPQAKTANNRANVSLAIAGVGVFVAITCGGVGSLSTLIDLLIQLFPHLH